MNLLASLPDSVSAEVTDTLIQAERLRIERIVSRGQASPPGFWYDQAENEFVLLIAGAARLEFEDKLVELTVGDWCQIAAHQKHRVAWTLPDEATIWLAVFYG
jgi:cupin 2 domain-containing protein